MTTLLRVLSKRAAMERSCHWTRTRLLAHQRASLAVLRRFAIERSPFYRTFHRGLESKPLDALPVLTKSILMENFDSLVTDRAVRLADAEAFLALHESGALFRDRYTVLATSGSTGRRGVFLFDPHEWIAALASISRPMRWAGVSPNPFRRARAAMIASTAPSHYSARVGASLASRWMPTLRMDAAEPLASVVERLNRWQPEIVGAYPSAWSALAEEQISGRLRIPLRHAACSAEALTDSVRAKVQFAWGVKIYNTYGATEYAPIAAECPFGRLHLLEDGAIVEIEDDRVLLTVFGRRTQPLIRYEIGDLVRASAAACECGRPFRIVESVEGRAEDVLHFPARAGGQVSVHPNAFHRVMEAAPAAGWQVIQEDGGLRVLLTGLRNPAAIETIARSIRELLETEGAAPAPVHVSAASELRRGATGKAPLILAQRKAAS